VENRCGGVCHHGRSWNRRRFDRETFLTTLRLIDAVARSKVRAD
jgi:hypothetical protein